MGTSDFCLAGSGSTVFTVKNQTDVGLGIRRGRGKEIDRFLKWKTCQN